MKITRKTFEKIIEKNDGELDEFIFLENVFFHVSAIKVIYLDDEFNKYEKISVRYSDNFNAYSVSGEEAVSIIEKYVRYKNSLQK